MVEVKLSVTANEGVNIEDFSVMLFIGASKIKVNNSITQKNRKMVSVYSTQLAKRTKADFRNKVKQKLDPEYQPYIFEIEKGKPPIVDSWGRATFFYAKLGRTRVPMYQPGTFMFESGVVNES